MAGAIRKKKTGDFIFVSPVAEITSDFVFTPGRAYRIATIGLKQSEFVVTNDNNHFCVFNLNDVRWQVDRPN